MATTSDLVVFVLSQVRPFARPSTRPVTPHAHHPLQSPAGSCPIGHRGLESRPRFQRQSFVRRALDAVSRAVYFVGHTLSTFVGEACFDYLQPALAVSIESHDGPSNSVRSRDGHAVRTRFGLRRAHGSESVTRQSCQENRSTMSVLDSPHCTTNRVAGTREAYEHRDTGTLLLETPPTVVAESHLYNERCIRSHVSSS
jgi:hypothetical protein